MHQTMTKMNLAQFRYRIAISFATASVLVLQIGCENKPQLNEQEPLNNSTTGKIKDLQTESTTQTPSEDSRLKNNSDSTFATEAQNWHSMLKQNNLEGWERTNFGGEGEVSIVDGTVELAMGYPMTGITFAANPLAESKLPKTDYELSLEAKRVDGTDFFCGLYVSSGRFALQLNR